MTVVSSRVKSAPSNTAAMSTSKPSAPVRYTRDAVEVRRRGGADLCGPLGLRRDVGIGLERHHEEGDRAVIGHLRRRNEPLRRELRQVSRSRSV